MKYFAVIRHPLLKIMSGFLFILTALFVQAAPQVGDKAPNFTLPGSDGMTYTLADFKDKAYVVIAFFPKAFTGG